MTRSSSSSYYIIITLCFSFCFAFSPHNSSSIVSLFIIIMLFSLSSLLTGCCRASKVVGRLLNYTPPTITSQEVVWVVLSFFFFSFLIFKEYFICHVVVHIVSPSDFLHPCDDYFFFLSIPLRSTPASYIYERIYVQVFFLLSGWPFDIVDLHRLAQPNNARRHPSLHISHVDIEEPRPTHTAAAQ